MFLAQEFAISNVGMANGPEPTVFLRLLAQARRERARRRPLQCSLRLPLELLELPLEAVAAAAGEPAVHEVLQDARWLDTPAPSRFPMRA